VVRVSVWLTVWSHAARMMLTRVSSSPCCSHQHIGEVMQAVVKKFGEFRGKNAMAGLKQEASMQDMIKAMKSMPEYNAMMRQVGSACSCCCCCCCYCCCCR